MDLSIDYVDILCSSFLCNLLRVHTTLAFLLKLLIWARDCLLASSKHISNLRDLVSQNFILFGELKIAFDLSFEPLTELRVPGFLVIYALLVTLSDPSDLTLVLLLMASESGLHVRLDSFKLSSHLFAATFELPLHLVICLPLLCQLILETLTPFGLLFELEKFFF